MEAVTMSVNESQKRTIVVQGVRDMENVYDNYERSEVSLIYTCVHVLYVRLEVLSC